jgi:hypothetical protein
MAKLLSWTILKEASSEGQRLALLGFSIRTSGQGNEEVWLLNPKILGHDDTKRKPRTTTNVLIFANPLQTILKMFKFAFKIENPRKTPELTMTKCCRFVISLDDPAPLTTMPSYPSDLIEDLTNKKKVILSSKTTAGDKKAHGNTENAFHHWNNDETTLRQ